MTMCCMTCIRNYHLQILVVASTGTGFRLLETVARAQRDPTMRRHAGNHKSQDLPMDIKDRL